MTKYKIPKLGFIYTHFLHSILYALHTHGLIKLIAPLVKYSNDLLGRQNADRGMDEVTFFYVGDPFCIHLGTKYTNSQEKMSAGTFGQNA